MDSRFNRYWKPAFQGRTLNSITRQDLKGFALALAESGLAPASVNKVMAVGTTCLSWAFREELLPADPTAGLVNFSGEAKKRGVLTLLEAQALFATKWKDARAYTASLLACTTGMRSGEVLALRQEDIGERVLSVRHSWSCYDGLEAPKNGEARKVPLLPEVRVKLLELARENPYGPGGFIFYGNLSDKPVDRSVLLDGFKEACKELGDNPSGWETDSASLEGDGEVWAIQGEKNPKGELRGTWTDPVLASSVYQQRIPFAEEKLIEIRYRRSLSKPDAPLVVDVTARGIVFHSFRHYYAARMADRMTADQVSRVTGHKSKAVFEEYADHITEENLEEVGRVGAEVFANILQFKKGA